MSLLHLILTGLKGLCPKCGKTSIFSGIFSVKEKCENCGLKLQEQDSGDGPAYSISFILCFILTPIALYNAMQYEISLPLLILIWSIVCFAFILLLLRPTKSLFILIHYKFVKKS